MKKNKNLLLITAVVGSFLLLGSWTETSLSLQSPQVQIQNTGLQIAAKTYDSEKSKQNLNRDLLSKGYVPVEITITNQTQKSYTLSRASVNLPCATAKEVTWSFTKKTFPRSIGYKIASFFFWPFSIAGSIDSIRVIKNHRNLNKDFAAKTLKDDDEIIPPFSSVIRVLFVKKDGFQKEFSVALQEVGAKELLVIRTQTGES